MQLKIFAEIVLATVAHPTKDRLFSQRRGTAPVVVGGLNSCLLQKGERGMEKSSKKVYLFMAAAIILGLMLSAPHKQLSLNIDPFSGTIDGGILIVAGIFFLFIIFCFFDKDKYFESFKFWRPETSEKNGSKELLVSVIIIVSVSFSLGKQIVIHSQSELSERNLFGLWTNYGFIDVGAFEAQFNSMNPQELEVLKSRDVRNMLICSAFRLPILVFDGFTPLTAIGRDWTNVNTEIILPMKPPSARCIDMIPRQELALDRSFTYVENSIIEGRCVDPGLMSAIREPSEVGNGSSAVFDDVFQNIREANCNYLVWAKGSAFFALLNAISGIWIIGFFGSSMFFYFVNKLAKLRKRRL